MFVKFDRSEKYFVIFLIRGQHRFDHTVIFVNPNFIYFFNILLRRRRWVRFFVDFCDDIFCFPINLMQSLIFTLNEYFYSYVSSQLRFIHILVSFPLSSLAHVFHLFSCFMRENSMMGISSSVTGVVTYVPTIASDKKLYFKNSISVIPNCVTSNSFKENLFVSRRLHHFQCGWYRRRAVTIRFGDARTECRTHLY